MNPAKKIFVHIQYFNLFNSLLNVLLLPFSLIQSSGIRLMRWFYYGLEIQGLKVQKCRTQAGKEGGMYSVLVVLAIVLC